MSVSPLDRSEASEASTLIILMLWFCFADPAMASRQWTTLVVCMAAITSSIELDSENVRDLERAVSQLGERGGYGGSGGYSGGYGNQVSKVTRIVSGKPSNKALEAEKKKNQDALKQIKQLKEAINLQKAASKKALDLEKKRVKKLKKQLAATAQVTKPKKTKKLKLTPPNKSTNADKKASFLQTWGKNCPKANWRTSEKDGLTAVICDPKGSGFARRKTWPQDYTFFSNNDPSQKELRRLPCPVKGKMWRSLQFRSSSHPIPSDQMSDEVEGQAGTSESRTGVAFGGGYVALQICGGAMYVDNNNPEHKTTPNPFCRGREILVIKANRILARKKATLLDPETRR